MSGGNKSAEPRAPFSMRRSDAIWLLPACAFVLVTMAALVKSGVLASGAAPDSAGYFAAAASDNPWGEPRHPLYGYLAGLFDATATDAGHVALAQAMLHIVAALALFAGARAAGITRSGSFALFAAALASQSALFQVPLLLPESPATSCLLLGFAATLAAARSASWFRLWLVPAMIAVGAAYLLRPAFLPAPFFLAALFAAFGTHRNHPRALARAVILFAALIAPFVIQSGVRLRTVGDFNIVSFGGFQMSAMAGFMLTPEMAEGFPERTRTTARAILSARESAETAGTVVRTPLNSSGQRSFVSAALGYFDIYARGYDDFLHGVIDKQQQAGERWVDFNRRLMAFSLDTARRAPLRWAAWVAGATSRLAGHMIVTNAIMLLALGALTVALLFAAVRRLEMPVCDGLGGVLLVAGAWIGATAPLTVLTTFPAARYIDTAATLLPAVPIAITIAIVRGLLTSRIAGND
jgi:broad specificity phosphatase PhoE